MAFHPLAARVAGLNVEAGKRKKKPAASRKAPVRRPPAPKPERTSRGLIERDILQNEIEYACRLELDLTAVFEGRTDQKKLLQLVKSELVSAIKASMTTVARSLNLSQNGVKVSPMRVECAVNDESEI